MRSGSFTLCCRRALSWRSLLVVSARVHASGHESTLEVRRLCCKLSFFPTPSGHTHYKQCWLRQTQTDDHYQQWCEGNSGLVSPMYHARSAQNSSPWSYFKSPPCKSEAKLAIAGGGTTIKRPEGLERRDFAGVYGQFQETNAGSLENTSLAVCANYSSSSSVLSDILHVQSAQQTSEQREASESLSVESHVDCTLSLSTPKHGKPERHSTSFKCVHVVEDSDLEKLGSGELDDLQQTSIDDGIIHKIAGFSFNTLDEGKGSTRSSIKRDLVDIPGDHARYVRPELLSCPIAWATSDYSINFRHQSRQSLPRIVDSKASRAKVTLKRSKSLPSERGVSDCPNLSRKSSGQSCSEDFPVLSPHPVSSNKPKKSWAARPLLQELNERKSEGRWLLTKQSPLPDTDIVPSRGASRNQDGHEIQALRSCMRCGTSRTPLWRNGPQGPKSLCNACGIRFKKTGRRLSSSKNSDVLSSPSLSVEVVCISGKLPKRKSVVGPEQAWPSCSTVEKNMQSLGAFSQKRVRSAEAGGHGRCSCNELNYSAGDRGNCMSDKHVEEGSPIFTLPTCSVQGSECVRSLVEFVTAGTDWKIQDCGHEKSLQDVSGMGQVHEALTDDEEGAFLLMALSCGFVDIRPQTTLVPYA